MIRLRITRLSLAAAHGLARPAARSQSSAPAKGTPAAKPAEKSADKPAKSGSAAKGKADSKPKIKPDEDTFAGLEFRSIGPAVSSGRITDLAVDPRDHSLWYVASAYGGVWKTTNAGTSWTPIFDDQGTSSIGCVTIARRARSPCGWAAARTTASAAWAGATASTSPRTAAAASRTWGSRPASTSAASSCTRPTPTSSGRQRRARCGRRAATAACTRRAMPVRRGSRS